MFCLGIEVEVLQNKCFVQEYMLKYSKTNVLFRNRSGSTPKQMFCLGIEVEVLQNKCSVLE